MNDWNDIKEVLPENESRVLAFAPGNKVWLPGKTGMTELKEVLILKFLENYFIENPSKTGKAKSPHLWSGEGSSNLFFEAGTGPVPTAESRVKVHYTGTLIDGTKFDSSYDRGEPAVFGVGQVIRGWTEALTMMPTGSRWQLFIPSELGYGTQVAPGGEIPSNSTLVFEVELIEIVE